MKYSKIDKSVQIILIVVLAIIVLVGMGYMTFISLTPTLNTVTGNGQATIGTMPDLVTVYFNIETEGKTSVEAKDKNAEIVDDLIIALLKEGFERKDIQTQNFNIYPDYDWNGREREIKGYRARHSIRVELSTEESDKIGKVIDAGVNAGAGISYINFELSQEKQSEYKAEAIKLAAEDAKIKAEALAEGLDKKLGRLVSVSDSYFDYSPWRIYEMGEEQTVGIVKEATTNIQPGEQKISASVRVIYKLR
jgi:uncharacterized protein YggE